MKIPYVPYPWVSARVLFLTVWAVDSRGSWIPFQEVLIVNYFHNNTETVIWHFYSIGIFRAILGKLLVLCCESRQWHQTVLVAMGFFILSKAKEMKQKKCHFLFKNVLDKELKKVNFIKYLPLHTHHFNILCEYIQYSIYCVCESLVLQTRVQLEILV